MNINYGDVIQSSFFPEPVRVQQIEVFGDTHHSIQAIGLYTNSYYHQIFTAEQLVNGSMTPQSNRILNWNDIKSLLHYHLLSSERYSSKNYVSYFKKIIPFPHQIDAVYDRFLGNFPVRFLLADDPGAGKTIMSGMLLKELQTRHNVKRILILAPPLVLTQWQQELSTKFNEEFTIISRSILNSEKINSFLKYSHCLASLNWCARDDIQQLIFEADFDLVIIDEAHKMAAYQTSNKKLSKTKLYTLGEKLLQRTPHALLLTATPHKGDSQNYRLLLKLLDPYVFHDQLKDDTLKEFSNPYIVRRLKEDMVDLNGQNIFPKRITKTIQYELSNAEVNLYENITSYVSDYYNKALKNRQNVATFALMILQRRLSSSLYALEQSLLRRKEKLTSLLNLSDKDRKKTIKKLSNSFQTQSEDIYTLNTLDEDLDGVVENIDLDGVNQELKIVEGLLSETKQVLRYHSERKYIELEDLLLGTNGLLHKGEKILIFTESVDTLTFLEKKLSLQISKIATIQGSQSISERMKHIDFFRNEAQIMIATDAGGESINLQFCNHLINYDIPWNPNKLEQRMGRIHRIGQKNDVLIFNLVAQNTREGFVLAKLFEKLDTMKEDLGQGNVYDFLGELLEGKLSLTRLMEETILSKKKLDQYVNELAEQLEIEQRSLNLTSNQWNAIKPSYDLQKYNQSIISSEINQAPLHHLSSLVEYSLLEEQVVVNEHNQVYSIDYLPPSFKKMYDNTLSWEKNLKFTSYKSDYKLNSNVSMITTDHFLYKWTMSYLKHKTLPAIAKKFKVSVQNIEPLTIWIYAIQYKNINQSIIYKQIVTLGKRIDGSIVQLNNNWFFHLNHLELKSYTDDSITDLDVLNIITSLIKKDTLHLKESKKINAMKLKQFITRSFEEQFSHIYDQIIQLQNNAGLKETKNLQKLKSLLSSLDKTKEKKFQEIDRQSSLLIDYPQLLVQLEITQNPTGTLPVRLFSTDFENLIRNYEKNNNRQLKQVFHPLGEVDYYSEQVNGEGRYIRLESIDEESVLINPSNMSHPIFIYKIDKSGNITENV